MVVIEVIDAFCNSIVNFIQSKKINRFYTMLHGLIMVKISWTKHKLEQIYY